jgi:hypothetical protein
MTFFCKTAINSENVAFTLATLCNTIQKGSCIVVLCCPR